MKKKMNKSILLSALSALAIGGIGAGATFALFTDRATTTVEIAAGKLDINSAIQNFKVYSVSENNAGEVIDENTNGYDLEEQTVVEEGKHLFKNEGWATYSNDNNGINLVHMSPGDKVTFTLAIDNGQTNINYLYRLHFRSTGSDNLVKGLVTTIGSEKLAGLKQYDSAWMAKTPNDNLDAIDFAIEMPVEKDNRYQMLEASFIVGIEAVQGNAVMTDAAAKVQIEEDVIAKGNVVNNESINLNGNAGNTNIATTASIPANEIEEGEVTYTVSNIVVNDAEGTNESTIGFDIDFKVNDVAHNTFNQPVTVTFNIGAGKVLQGVYHGGVLMDANDYSYDANSGILTIYSSSFSPFTVKYQNEAEQQESSSEEQVVYTKVKDIEMGKEVLMDVRVVKIINNGFVVADETGYLFVYSKQNYFGEMPAVNTMVVLAGTVGQYNGAPQLVLAANGISESESELIQLDQTPIPMTEEIGLNLYAAVNEAANSSTFAAGMTGNLYSFTGVDINANGTYYRSWYVGSAAFENNNMSNDEFAQFEAGLRYNIVAMPYRTFQNYLTMLVLSFEAVEYKVVGSFNNWSTKDGGIALSKMEYDKDGKAQYVAEGVHFEANTEIKVVDSNKWWYPGGETPNYVIQGEGDYNIFFVPKGEITGEGWYYGHFYVEHLGGQQEESSATSEEPSNVAYYVVGTFNNWTASEAYALGFTTEDNDGTWYASGVLDIPANSELKIVSSDDVWFPAEGDNYIVNDAGKYVIWFVPQGVSYSGYFGGYFSVNHYDTSFEQTMAYIGETTTTMDGTNQAALLGLDDTIFSVRSELAENQTQHVGLNKTGNIRLYSNERESLVITGLTIDIDSLVLEETTNLNSLKVTVNGEVIENDGSGIFKLSAPAGTEIRLTNAASTGQVQFKRMTIHGALI